MTINSTLSQVTWNQFKGVPLSEPAVAVREIQGSYNVVTLSYVMTSTGDNGELEYYNVEEYYRIRYTASRIYLLNFERTMNQIFRGENDSFYDNCIQLGIRSGDIAYQSNENGSVVCFVQEGELWSYDENNDRLYQVFSFRGFEGIDDRENYDEHDIKIIDIDEAGSINFAVYGYMNRGEHEGEVGIGIYHFDSVANTVEEEAFLPSTQSYQVMKSNIGQLIYENEDNELFIMMEWGRFIRSIFPPGRRSRSYPVSRRIPMRFRIPMNFSPTSTERIPMPQPGCMYWISQMAVITRSMPGTDSTSGRSDLCRAISFRAARAVR